MNIIQQHKDAIADRFGQKGLSLMVSRDPEFCGRSINEVGKVSVHPMSQIEKEDLEQDLAFWLFLVRDERAVACISARRFQVEDTGFDRHIREIAELRYRSRSEPIQSVAHPLIEEVSGSLVYFGGIEISADERGSNKMLCDFAQFAKLTAAQKWDFDWMYTIIAYQHRRLADDYGFHWRVRNAIQWTAPAPEGLASDQMILATNQAHFEHVLVTVQPGQL
ncbi:MAG: hypothetical protein JXR13_20130 [Thalassovita sp.]